MIYTSKIETIMDAIKVTTPLIEGEIEDAKNYAALAMAAREHFPELAQTFFDLSEEETGHINRLHTTVANLIDEYRKEKGDPPAPMLAVYDYLHKQQIEKAAEVKALRAMFKE